jgi:hypothetical protein
LAETPENITQFLRGVTYELANWQDSDQVQVEVPASDDDLTTLLFKVAHLLRKGGERPGYAYRLIHDFLPAFTDWKRNRSTLNTIPLPRTSTHREIWEAVDRYTDEVRDHPSSTYETFVDLTNEILGWYETGAGKGSSTQSPSKRVSFDLPGRDVNADLADLARRLSEAEKSRTENISVAELRTRERDEALAREAQAIANQVRLAKERDDRAANASFISDQWRASREELARERSLVEQLREELANAQKKRRPSEVLSAGDLSPATLAELALHDENLFPHIWSDADPGNAARHAAERAARGETRDTEVEAPSKRLRTPSPISLTKGKGPQ